MTIHLLVCRQYNFCGAKLQADSSSSDLRSHNASRWRSDREIVGSRRPAGRGHLASVTISISVSAETDKSWRLLPIHIHICECEEHGDGDKGFSLA